MENFLLPDEIVLKIFGYLGLGELIQCAKVSRRFNTICKDNSLGYRSSMLIMKDLTMEDQKYIYKIIIARPELTKLEIHSISWEEGDGKRLSVAMATRKFLGPKSYSLAKKKKVLKALGASGRVKNFRIQYNVKPSIYWDVKYISTVIFGRYQIPFKEWRGATYSNFPRRPLKIGLFYSMPTCLSSWDFSAGIEDESQKRRALTPTYYWKKKILHTFLFT